MNTTRLYWLFALLFLGLITCDTPADPVEQTTEDQLQNVVWKLDSLKTPINTHPRLIQYHNTIDFSGTDLVQIDLECTDYYGTYYSGSDQSLSIILPDSSDEFCLYSGARQSGPIFASSFEHIENYQVEGDQLTLSSADGTYLIYLSAEVKDAALVNIMWRLDTLITASTMFIPDHSDDNWRKITTILYDAWVAAGAGPCEHINSGFDLGPNNGLIFYPVSSYWEIPCTPEFDRILPIFTDALNNIASYQLTGQQLILYDQDKTTRLSYSVGAVDEAFTKSMWPHYYSYYFDVTKSWRLDSLIGAAGTVIPETEPAPSMVFSKGLEVWLSDICNDVLPRSFLNAELGSLSFDMDAGYPVSGQCSAADSTFLAVLDAVRYYNLTDDQLVLSDSLDNQVLYFTGLLYEF